MQEIDESEIKSNFQELCRLCASYDNVKIGLFTEEGVKRQLRKKIQICLPFKVEENDGFPKSLCFKCVYNLETTYEFRCKCIQANRSLEKHLYQLERDKQSKNVIPGRSYKIHPEVSIFAISSESNKGKQNEPKCNLPAECEEESPNPLDFLEVGVNSDEGSNIRPKSGFQDGKKSHFWKTDRRWLSVEHKPLQNDSTTAQPDDGGARVNMKYFDTSTPDDNGSRRKSCKPRRITRESEECAANTSSSSSQATKSTDRLLDDGEVAGSNQKRKDSEENEDCVVVAAPAAATDDDDESRPQERFTCLLCEKSFGLRSALNKHFSTIHGIEPYEVVSPPSTTTTTTTTQGRAMLPQSFVTSSETSTKNEEDLENMMEQETVIFCEVCRREFQDRASLWLHMVHAHREEASVSCGICLKICCDNITLIEHVNTAHSGDKAIVQRRYSCQVCGRQHDSRQKLLKHATLHTLIDNQGQTIQPEEMVSLNNAFAPRECPICRKRFFNEEKLNHHTQNFHNDTNDTTLSPSTVYKCELCASAHATRIDRWWHMYYSHLGDARVTCQRKNCRKIFVSSALKEEHAKTHHESQGEFTNTCEICGKLWESRTVFYKHMMNVHPKCLPTICGICMKIFSNVPELRQHVRADHPPLEESGGICCDVCGRPYAERSKMLRHRRVHNVTDGVPTATSTAKKKDDLVCSFCPDVSFEQYEDVAQHRRVVHQLFVCDLCPKFYNGNNHLWKHVSKQHKGDPNVTCNLCLRTSASRAHLERHKIKYHSDPVDKLLNKQQQQLQQQQQQHQQQLQQLQQQGYAAVGASLLAAAATSAQQQPPPPLQLQPQQPHKCSLCGKLFRIRSLLKKHLKSCKGVKAIGASAAAAAKITAKVLPVNGVFPCSKCPKVFQLQSVLSKHVKNSHAQHACEVCQTEGEVSAFDTKKGLLQHIRERHADNSELACDVAGCGKVLRLKADLKKHKLEHQRGYFTYICEICGDMFSNRKKLRKHLLTYHKSDVQYLCAICASIHQSVDELVQHVHGAHSAVLHRPCTCQICGKNWTVGSKVVDHITKVHGAEYKPCRICWKVFTDEQAFQQHVDNHPAVEEKPSSANAKAVALGDDATTSNETAITLAPPSRCSSPCSIVDDDGDGGGGGQGNDDSEMAEDKEEKHDRSSVVAGVKRPLQRNEDDSSSLGGGGAGDNEDDENASKRLRRKYKCIWCKESFRSTDELRVHKAAQHADSHQQQRKSSGGVENDGSVTSSVAAVTEAEIKTEKMKCASATATDTNRTERWTDIRPIACDCCEKIWNSKKQLWQHLIRSHAYESQHTCGICLQVCRDYFDLFYHLDSQHSDAVNDTGANRFACFICGHYHNSQSKLDKHFSLHKNAPSRCEYTCQYCRKLYKSVAYYRDHLRTHEAEQPAETKTKPISEFSGFSINHILATKNDRSRSLSNVVVAPAPTPAPTVVVGGGGTAATVVKIDSRSPESRYGAGAVSFQPSEYDSKVKDEHMEELIEEMDDDDDDDSVEQDDVEEETGAKDGQNGNSTAIGRQSEKRTESTPSEAYADVSDSDDEVENCSSKSDRDDDDDAAAADDDDEDESGNVMLNGGSATDNDFSSFGMNNNQKQRASKFQNDKTNFRNSTGDNYLRRVTDNL